MNTKNCIFVFVVFILICFISLSIYSLMFDTEINRCSMTYMFEMPEFQHFKLKPKIRKKFPRYSLIYYSEGGTTLPTKFSGIPVLFLPGNAGSHKQVRSLGSVALRMAESWRTPFSFDYFAADFNDELSAIYSGYIISQTEFTAACIEYIFSLYGETAQQPNGLVIVGHSMGGVVARNLFLLPSFDASRIHTLITLATPHLLPIVGFDRNLDILYRRMNEYWLKNTNGVLSNVSVVSLTGGPRDIQVWDGYGDITKIVPTTNSLWVSTTAVNMAWASTDHLCIVWCKEIVMNINRALFDAVDRKTRQITLDQTKRINSFRRHLLNSAPSSTNNDRSTFTINTRAQWYYKTDSRSFTFEQNIVSEVAYLKVGPLVLNPETRFIVTANQVKLSWLFICHENTSATHKKPCSSLIDISWASRPIPPVDMGRKMALLDSSMVTGNDGVFLVLKLTKGERETQVIFEEFNETDRIRTMNPGFFGWLTPTIPQTQDHAVFYRLVLPSLSSVARPARINIRVLECTKSSDSIGLVALHSPWDNGFTYAPITLWDGVSQRLQLTQSRPDMDNSSAYVDLLLEESCQYTVYLYTSPVDYIVQILRMHVGIVPAFIVAHVLVVLSNSLGSSSYGHKDQSLISSLLPNTLLIPVAMLYPLIGNFTSTPNDWLRLKELGLIEAFTGVLLPVLSLALLLTLIVIIDTLVSIMGVALRVICSKCFSGGRSRQNLLIIIGLQLLTSAALGYFLCDCIGLVGVSLASLTYCIFERAFETGNKRHKRFHMMIAILMLLLSCFNVHNLVVWAKQATELYSRRGRNLPSIPRFTENESGWPNAQHSFVAALAFGMLVWWQEHPQDQSQTTHVTAEGVTKVAPHLLRLVALYTMFYSLISLHYLCCTLLFSLVVIAYHATASRSRNLFVKPE